MNTNTLPETDDEIEEFIRQCESGEIPEPPPFNSSKLLARMCVMQDRIDKLEEEGTRLHSLWHAAEEKLVALRNMEWAWETTGDRFMKKSEEAFHHRGTIYRECARRVREILCQNVTTQTPT